VLLPLGSSLLHFFLSRSILGDDVTLSNPVGKTLYMISSNIFLGTVSKRVHHSICCLVCAYNTSDQVYVV